MESIRGLFLGIEVSEQSEVLSQISEMFEDLCSGIKFVNSCMCDIHRRVHCSEVYIVPPIMTDTLVAMLAYLTVKAPDM